jgi:hypothetical protein
VKGRWWSYEGWHGREHLEKEWKRSRDEEQRTSQASRTTSISITSRRVTRLKQFATSYTGRSTGVMGSTYQHLLEPKHGFEAAELAGLSEHELERLHSACHHYGVNAAWLRSYAERRGW